MNAYDFRITALAIYSVTSCGLTQSAEPNLLLDLRRSLAEAVVAQSIERPEPIRDMIKSTRIYGSGQFCGEVSVNFVPCDSQAIIDVVLKGSLNSQTIGVNGPVHIHSLNHTALNARKRIMLDSFGIRDEPAIAFANQATELEGISTKFRAPADFFVRRIAKRAYIRTNDSFIKLAEAKTAHTVGLSLDRDVEVELSKANVSFWQDFRKPLERRGLFPESLQMSTTVDNFLLRSRLGDANVMHILPSPTINNDADLCIRVHDTFINIGSARLLSGKTFDSKTIDQEFADLLGSHSRPAKPVHNEREALEEDFSITFAKERPMEIHFENDRIIITIRCDNIKTQFKDLTSMIVLAEYQLRKSDVGFELVRDKDLEMQFSEKRLTSRQIFLLDILQVRFSTKLLKDRFKLDIPLDNTKKKLGTLFPIQAVLTNGWFALGYKRIS